MYERKNIIWEDRREKLYTAVKKERQDDDIRQKEKEKIEWKVEKLRLGQIGRKKQGWRGRKTSSEKGQEAVGDRQIERVRQRGKQVDRLDSQRKRVIEREEEGG